jgi:hypothetical protein
VPPAVKYLFEHISMNKPLTRMCKACKEAWKSVDFSRPIASVRPRKQLKKSSHLVACPKCGTVWQAARPGAAESPRP